MKTIAVLTDFSERSEHAAKYALHLAQKLRANILLFNAFLVPADIPMLAAEVTWPSDYDEEKAETEKELQKLSTKLIHQLEKQLVKGDYLPLITFECKEGPICNALGAIENNKDVFLTVIGTHGADRMTTLVFGNSCRQIIDGTRLPLLLVPEHARTKSPEKFAFATDLDVRDIKYLRSLTDFAAYFSGEITVTNVSKAVGGQTNKELALFIDHANDLIDYKKVSYTTIPEQTTGKGIERLLEDSKPDMLVMMHHENSFLKALFNESATQKIAAHTPVPILIFPYSANKTFTF